MNLGTFEPYDVQTTLLNLFCFSTLIEDLEQLSYRLTLVLMIVP